MTELETNRHLAFINSYKYQSISNAKIALTSRLYVSGWFLNHSLHYATQNDACAYVDIEHVNNTPVGILYADQQHIQVFVKKSYRRQGIGSQLINRLKSLSPRFIPYAVPGIDGSECFFQRNKIHLYNITGE